jgi:hypothetical protein
MTVRSTWGGEWSITCGLFQLHLSLRQRPATATPPPFASITGSAAFLPRIPCGFTACQSARKRDPGSACKKDPRERSCLLFGDFRTEQVANDPVWLVLPLQGRGHDLIERGERSRAAGRGARLRRRAAAAGITGSLLEPVTPHGMRAGFVTTAYRNGVPDEEIMGHTRHRSLTTMRSYVRRAKLGSASPSGKLDL